MEPSLATVARRQMALLTLGQALESGYSLRQVQQRCEAGSWERIHAGVYRVAGAPDSWEQRVLAACLGAGEGAVASHRSAARLWGIGDAGRPQVELSVRADRYHRLRGVTVHRSSDLEAGDATERLRIPVTTPARTLVDLGAVQGVRSVERALDAALSRRLVTLASLHAALYSVARRGRRGAGILRALLEARSPAAGLAESVLEARMLRICGEQRLPEPACQYHVRTGERLVARVDFAYPRERLALEVDGYESHASLDAFRHDRRRQNELVGLGWTVLRFTWDDVVHDPARVARAVRAVLRAKSNTAGTAG
jgi:very-short-patch-repair endonuclease/predicted transcriptional regulator of viral defense system